MEKRVILGTFVVCFVLSLFAAQVFAGGPVCPPPMPMCAPPMCAPMPVCGPPPCPPNPCGPFAYGPPPCPPPSRENPCVTLIKGACSLVAGICSLPFKVVDSLCRWNDCPPKCYPAYNRMAMCAPPACMPPMCGPAGYPGMGYGMGMGRPAGFGYGAPKARMVPFAKKEKLPKALMATPTDGFFGAYW